MGILNLSPPLHFSCRFDDVFFICASRNHQIGYHRGIFLSDLVTTKHRRLFNCFSSANSSSNVDTSILKAIVQYSVMPQKILKKNFRNQIIVCSVNSLWYFFQWYLYSVNFLSSSVVFFLYLTYSEILMSIYFILIWYLVVFSIFVQQKEITCMSWTFFEISQYKRYVDFNNSLPVHFVRSGAKKSLSNLDSLKLSFEWF